MTIDEAIRILETFHDQSACTLDATSANAIRLGIEALKWVEKERTGYEVIKPGLLEGETT